MGLKQISWEYLKTVDNYAFGIIIFKIIILKILIITLEWVLSWK